MEWIHIECLVASTDYVVSFATKQSYSPETNGAETDNCLKDGKKGASVIPPFTKMIDNVGHSNPDDSPSIVSACKRNKYRSHRINLVRIRFFCH